MNNKSSGDGKRKIYKPIHIVTQATIADLNIFDSIILYFNVFEYFQTWKYPKIVLIIFILLFPLRNEVSKIIGTSEAGIFNNVIFTNNSIMHSKPACSIIFFPNFF
jgi:hypothetical protein